MIKLLTGFIVYLLLILILPIHSAVAASSTIGFSPETGYITKPFTVDVVVNGHGDKFNAAEATVTFSSNLKIKDLTLGNCNFSFLHTPTVQNPSFAGVIIQ